MWKATKISVTKDERMVYVTVKFDNLATGESFEQLYHGDNLTEDTLKVIVKAKIDSIDSKDAAFEALKDTVGEEIIPATKEELERFKP